MPVDHAVIRVPLDSLRPHPRNYRVHPDDQLAHIVRSIELHGQYRNIVVARDHTILAGHGVALAAGRLGLDEVSVVRLDIDPDDARALQVLAGDNEISNLADVDDRVLTELLRELAAADVENLLSTGFDAETLAALALVTRPASEIATLDQAGEWLGLPGFEPAETVTTLTVKFDSVAERDRFLGEIGAEHVNRSGGGWTVWWPDRAANDLVSVRFQ